MLPKPEPYRRVKARRARHESAVKREVRAACVERDGYCRLAFRGMGPCGGPSEWMHMSWKRRSLTMGQAAEARHTTSGSAMGCRLHHQRLDHKASPWIDVEPLTDSGADGRMRWTSGEDVYEEEA